MDFSEQKKILNEYKRKASIGGTVSINDLKDKEFDGVPLQKKEMVAIRNFDLYRISTLNRKIDEPDFHNKYRQLQVMANLLPFDEFLKKDYNF